MTRKKKAGWVVLFVLFALILAALILRQPDGQALKELEATRSAMQAQGYLLDLDQIDFSTSPEQRSRMKWLLDAAEARSRFYDLIRPKLKSPDAGVVHWKRDRLQEERVPLSRSNWPKEHADWDELREELEQNRPALEMAIAILLEGPIQFEPGGKKESPLLPHLSQIRQLVGALVVKLQVELHDRKSASAYQTLQALTWLVTNWKPEPVEISHLVRFRCNRIAIQATWQALQFDGWSDEQLRALQQAWESVDYLSQLPETAAWGRASALTLLQKDRAAPISDSTGTFIEAGQETWRLLKQAPTSSAKYVGQFLKGRGREIFYRRKGTYEDERAVMDFYRNKEDQLRKAAAMKSWEERRNFIEASFNSTHRSMIQSVISMRQIQQSATEGKGLVGSAAEAEAERQMVITSLSLERYRVKHGRYPDRLGQLVPEFLKTPPIDFMDGQALRYRLVESDVVLYSVGLDGKDDGGTHFVDPRPFGIEARPPKTGYDLVWPRPLKSEP